MILTVLTVCVVALYALMAVRAFQSGTTTDHLLGAAQLIGLLLMFTAPVAVSTTWLITCAGAYLTSQMLTQARVLSRCLPILAGLLAAALYWVSTGLRI